LPLVGAIVAGNVCVIKLFELSEYTAQILAELFPKYLDPECYRIINGAIQESTVVLDQRFDKILYTGNGIVARIIVQKAAKYLTPVILELGGKSPAILIKIQIYLLLDEESHGENLSMRGKLVFVRIMLFVRKKFKLH